MTAARSCLYEVLGVSVTASPVELKQAYRRKQRSAHPDTGGTAERFHALQSAWEVLGEPARRADYDRSQQTKLRAAASRRSSPFADQGPRSSSSNKRSANSSDRGPTRTTGPSPKIDRADSHGHPGGSARLIYLERLRSWILNPRPPSPPTPIRVVSDVGFPRGFLFRAWLRLCLKMCAGLAATAAIVALVIGWRMGLIGAETTGFWPVVALAAAAFALAGLLSSIPISLLRHWRSPYRRELVRFRKEKNRKHAEEQAAYLAATRVYEENLRSQPEKADAVLAAPFSVAARRVAPAGIRCWLDKALAQEETARALAKLDESFSIWHDLAIGVGSAGLGAGIDHLVLGHQGLVLVESINEKGPVSVRKRALTRGEKAASMETTRTRMLAASQTFAGVSAVLLVYADSAIRDPRPHGIDGTPMPTFVVGSSLLAEALTTGLPGIAGVSVGRREQLRHSVAGRVRFA